MYILSWVTSFSKEVFVALQIHWYSTVLPLKIRFLYHYFRFITVSACISISITVIVNRFDLFQLTDISFNWNNTGWPMLWRIEDFIWRFSMSPLAIRPSLRPCKPHPTLKPHFLPFSFPQSFPTIFAPKPHIYTLSLPPSTASYPSLHPSLISLIPSSPPLLKTMQLGLFCKLLKGVPL